MKDVHAAGDSKSAERSTWPFTRANAWLRAGAALPTTGREYLRVALQQNYI
jgi:hypothetical protein